MSPPTAPMTFIRPSAPVVSWNTTGASTVTVDGPGVSTVDATGSMPICPTAASTTWTVCVSPPGDYTYTVRVIGENGDVLSASATLTIA